MRMAAAKYGVTEPLEFSFMFLAPALYVVHAALMGISLAIAAFFHWTVGFSFSAGLVDFVLSSKLPLANQPYMLLLQGLVFAVIYYVLFRFLITKFNLKTPGREEDTDEINEAIEIEGAAAIASTQTVPSGDKFAVMAAKIYEGLGGDANVTSVDNCVTRLRIEVSQSNEDKAIEKVDENLTENLTKKTENNMNNDWSYLPVKKPAFQRKYSIGTHEVILP
jgi:PTS system N-acetylglucosamine-specific IIC component